MSHKIKSFYPHSNYQHAKVEVASQTAKISSLFQGQFNWPLRWPQSGPFGLKGLRPPLCIHSLTVALFLSSPCAGFYETLKHRNIFQCLSDLTQCLTLMASACLHPLLHCCTITFLKVNEPLGLYYRYHSRELFSLVMGCKNLSINILVEKNQSSVPSLRWRMKRHSSLWEYQGF